MKHTSRHALAGLALALSMPIGAKDIQLPPDGVQLTPSAMPGYAKAQANCTMCHSAE
jgi:sulfite dehydrogenase (cytochrome) subunit B